MSRQWKGRHNRWLLLFETRRSQPVCMKGSNGNHGFVPPTPYSMTSMRQPPGMLRLQHWRWGSRCAPISLLTWRVFRKASGVRCQTGESFHYQPRSFLANQLSSLPPAWPDLSWLPSMTDHINALLAALPHWPQLDLKRLKERIKHRLVAAFSSLGLCLAPSMSEELMYQIVDLL